MLKILINDLSDEVIELVKTYKFYVSDYFDIVFDKSWFLDPYVVDIIKEIDNTVVNGDLTLHNRVLGSIVPSQLSSGCKGLILAYKTDCKIDGDRLGDNCWSRLLNIASKKDVDIVLRHIPILPESFSAYLLNTKTIINKSDYISNFYTINGLGMVSLVLNTKNFKCILDLREKVTIIKGNSGVGKTTLINYLNRDGIQDFVSISNNFGYEVLTKSRFKDVVNNAVKHIERYNNVNFKSLDNKTKKNLLYNYWESDSLNFPYQDSIIFIDDEDFVSSLEFTAFFDADKYNYYVIMNRSHLATIGYSVDSVYDLVAYGNNHFLRPRYTLEQDSFPSIYTNHIIGDNNKERFIELLKSYGVSKCRVENVDFDNPKPWGRILVDVSDYNLLNEIYDIFTKDGLLDEDQSLLVGHDDFTEVKPNFSLD